MQNVRPETSMPITQQTPSQEQSIIRQQSAPIPPRTQQDTEEEKKSFLVVYSDGRQERVTDLDQFIKANPDLIIQRRYQSPQLPIEQNIPQPQSQETPKQSKLKPDEQIFLPIQEQEPQKSLLIQQPLLQNIVTSKQLQDTIINKSTPSLQNNFNEITIPKVIDIATEPQLSMISKPLANSKSEEIVTTAIENMIKSVFDNFNQKQIDMSSGKDKSQTLSQSQTHSTTRKPLDPVPRPQRKIIDVNWNQKKQTESPKPITQSGKGKKMSQNNMLYSDDNITTTSNAYTSQILTPQTISDKHKFTISKNIVQKPLEENNKSKDGSSEKFEKIKENIVIPEIVFKIEDVNLQAKPFSQSEKIIVSEDVLTVEPTKEEIKIQVQEFLNKAEGSEKPIITEKIIIDTEALEDKINKQIKSKKENPEEEIIIDENIDIDNYDNTDDNSKYIQEPKLDINIIKEKAGEDKDRTTEEKQLNDASKKTKKDKLKKKEKQPNKEKPAAKKEEMDEEQIDQDEPVIEVIINREEIKPSNRYDVQKKENQSPQEEEMVMEEEEEVEPEDDNQPTKDDQNDKKEEPKRNEKQNYKEEFVKKYDEPEDEDDSEYIKALKDSIRREKLINKEIIRNGENKRDTKVKQEDGMTVITTKAGEFYVEEIKNEDLVKLQQDLNTPGNQNTNIILTSRSIF
ncbi:hypothetical protein EVAR_64024_1 [Eumeta japonica]|uniref:Uncharacterized protein n=1 Tax=Eumeta variegata TaxID=151549 RepID=A0A4C1Z5R2_EUMVA|nr:hypothetical protein EVAR_64024_1 [Eumeta japonica]